MSSAVTLTDMFCGCGGSTTGAAAVAGVEVRMAMNHWRLAVDSHNTNHPETDHDCADISQTHPGRYQRTTGLIASPECTNHSLAKGARRKNLAQGDFFKQTAIDPSAVRSRATMWDVVTFAEQHRYEFIITENVVDVRYWNLFEPWLRAMHALGYLHQCVYLNAMFAHSADITGFAPQSRDRIYIVFWKRGNPKPDLDIRPAAPCARCGDVQALQAWKPGRNAGKYKQQYIYRCPVCTAEVTPYYYAALNALDFSLPAERIGDRARPLKEKTIARIEYGLKKFGLHPQVVTTRYTSGIGCRVRDAAAPMPTHVGDHFAALVQPFLVETQFSHSGDNRSRPVTAPLTTSTTNQSTGVVLPFTVSINAYDVADNVRSTADELPTQITTGKDALVIPGGFIPVMHGTSTAHGLTDALGCITAGAEHHALVVGHSALLTMRGPRNLSDLAAPLPTQVAAGIQNWLVQRHPFLASYYGKDQAQLVTEAMATLSTNDRHALIEQGGEPPRVEDCYFRMLQPHEMKAGQGFPQDYVILGTKKEQVKQIGNANPPPTMQLLVQRCVESLEGVGGRRRA